MFSLSAHHLYKDKFEVITFFAAAKALCAVQLTCGTFGFLLRSHRTADHGKMAILHIDLSADVKTVNCMDYLKISVLSAELPWTATMITRSILLLPLLKGAERAGYYSFVASD